MKTAFTGPSPRTPEPLGQPAKLLALSDEVIAG
jgi:hypothetical protein